MNLARSDIMKKGVVFPQFISTKRTLMMASILKQSSILGFNGMYDEDQLLESVNTYHIPRIHGRNVLVGLLDWNGYTHEDSAVISESLARKLVTYKRSTEIVENIQLPTLHVVSGEKIKPNSVLASVKNTTELKKYSSTNKVNAIIDKIEFEKDLIEGQIVNRFKIHWTARYDCSVGSKISNLHSVKNIISAIMPDDRMPIMQDGTPLELLVSPTSISNRKNPSMIMESMLGMYLREIGKKHNIPIPKMLIIPFDKAIDFKKASRLLLSVKLPENGMFRLKNGTKGHVFKYSSLVGYTFLMRLHHHSEDKIKFSNDINLDHRGFAQLGVGSQRLNRDEMEVLHTYNSYNIINEAKELNKNTSVCETIKEYVSCIGYEYE